MRWFRRRCRRNCDVGWRAPSFRKIFVWKECKLYVKSISSYTWFSFKLIKAGICLITRTPSPTLWIFIRSLNKKTNGLYFISDSINSCIEAPLFSIISVKKAFKLHDYNDDDNLSKEEAAHFYENDVLTKKQTRESLDSASLKLNPLFLWSMGLLTAISFTWSDFFYFFILPHVFTSNDILSAPF